MAFCFFGDNVVNVERDGPSDWFESVNVVLFLILLAR